MPNYFTSLRRIAAISVLLLVIAAVASDAQEMYDPAQQAGSLSQHGQLSFVPWERIDTYSGNITLSIDLLTLPSAAGLAVRIRQVYNSIAGGWSVDAGAPTVSYTQGGYPVVRAQDGSTIPFLKSSADQHIYYSTTFSRFDATFRILVTALGIRYEFREDGLCQQISDSFGNYISYTYYEPSSQYEPARLHQVIQRLGNQASRVVTFGYDGYALSSITYGARVWSFQSQSGPPSVRTITLPTGDTWRFETTLLDNYPYTMGSSLTVTTPTGGWVSYLIVANLGDPPDNNPSTRWSTYTLRERQSGGPDVAAGRWLFTYWRERDVYDWDHEYTTVEGASGTLFHAEYSHLPGSWEADLEFAIEGTGADIVRTDYTWQGGVQLGEPMRSNGFPLTPYRATLPHTKQVTVNGKSYLTSFNYEDTSFNHFGQPKTIVETGDFTRTTTFQFHAFPTWAYRGDAVSELTVTSEGDSDSQSATYNDTTGFVTSRTVGGVTTAFVQGNFGNVDRQTVGTGPNAQVTWYEYDKGVVSGIHGPISTITMEINDDGTVHSTSQAGRTTSFSYYPDGRREALTPPLGNATTTTYATDGTWAKATRGGAWTKTCYDGFGRQKATITSALVEVDTAYDEMGRVRRKSLPFGTSSDGCPTGQAEGGIATTFTHDILGRVTRVDNPDDAYTPPSHVTMAYNIATQPTPNVATTDERGYTTTRIFIATGSPMQPWLKQVIEPGGNATTYSYNGLGSLTGVTSPAQATVPTVVTRTWHYGTHNRLEYEIQPESGETQFTYDTFGRLASKKAVALNQTTWYYYDDENRLTDVTSPDPAYSIHAEYDQWGHRWAVSNGYVSSTFDYDAADQLRRRVDIINTHRFESRLEFDDNGNLTDIWYPSGNHVLYAYDANNRLIGVSDAARGLLFAHDVHYYDWGGLCDYQTGNGVTHSFTYDARRRPLHIGSKKIDEDDILGLTYGYDDAGNITSIQDHRPEKSATYSYDALARMDTAIGPWGTIQWGYDAIGNRKSQAQTGTDTILYDYSSNNRLNHASGGQAETFYYDGAGRLTTNDQGAYAYTYTPNHQQATASIAGALTTYWYDADDQRVRKMSGSDVNSTYYLRGPMGVLSEFAGSANLVGWSVDYVYATGHLIATTRVPAGAWRQVNVTQLGGPGTVTSWPAGVDCGSSCEGRFTQGTQVTLTATPNDGQTFLGWSGACGTGTTPTVTLTVGASNVACTATFSGGAPTELTVSKAGSGTVSSSPLGIACGDACTADFARGAIVTLTATPAEGSRFAHWGGSCGTGTASPVTMTMVAAGSCTATFTRINTLTVAKAGEGAGESLVTSTPAGISCGTNCSASFDSGTVVTLTAEPAEGYEFATWLGIGCGTGTVTLDEARNCTAVFSAIPPPSGCDLGAEQDCRNNGGTWDSELCECHYWWLDPLLIPLDGHPVRLTGVAGGVPFDVNGDGAVDRVAWTVAGAQVGFLVLDRNGNGVIDSLGELFGQAVTGRRRPGGTANSFADLALLDRPENGGNGDGEISAADAVYAQLRLWVDANHDGVSQPGELLTLPQTGLVAIELAAQPVGRRDRYGNYFKYRAIAHRTSGAPVPVWDVFLAVGPNGSAPASAAGLSGFGANGARLITTGLAGLGAGLIAVAFVGLLRSPRRHRTSILSKCRTLTTLDGRLLRPSAWRVGVTGMTALAVVLLWPSATFGQTWQVVEYYDTDAIGSVRAVTDTQGQVIARHDFLPFGEELNPQTPPSDKRLFTEHERDSESAQDYSGARYYSPGIGRFTSPDPIVITSDRLLDPQQLNLYAYARNNPLMYVDPDGRSFIVYSRADSRIYIFANDGRLIGDFPAANNVERGYYELQEDRYTFTSGSVNGPWKKDIPDLPNDYDVNGRYGTYGIVTVDGFWDANGRYHDGIGIHAGRLDAGGYQHMTWGCIRTTEEAMNFIDVIASLEPLTALYVRNDTMANVPPTAVMVIITTTSYFKDPKDGKWYKRTTTVTYTMQ